MSTLDAAGPTAAGDLQTRKPALDRFWVRFSLKMGVLGLILLAWHLYSGHVSPILMPSPSRVFEAGREMVRSGEIFTASGESLRIFAIGYALAVGSGVVIGVLFGRVRLFAVSTEHVFNALYVTPQIALLPLLIVWFGLGTTSKIAIIFLVSYFPIMFNTADGMRQVSRGYVEVARSYGASEVQLLREVTLPSIFPYVMTGLRLGAGRGLTGMVVAEIFTAISGLGGIIVTSGNTLQTAKLFVPIFVLGIIGMIVIQGGTYLENKLVAWKQTERAF